MNFFTRTVRLAVSAYGLASSVVPHVENLLGPGKGAEKRQKAIDTISRELGADLPSWMDEVLAKMLGIIVDAVVHAFNAEGLFPKSAAE